MLENVNKEFDFNTDGNPFITEQLQKISNLSLKIKDIIKTLSTIIESQTNDVTHLFKLSQQMKALSNPETINFLNRDLMKNEVSITLIIIMENLLSRKIESNSNWVYEDYLFNKIIKDKYLILSYNLNINYLNLEFCTNSLTKYIKRGISNYIIDLDSVVNKIFHQGQMSWSLVIQELKENVEEEKWNDNEEKQYSNYNVIKLRLGIIPTFNYDDLFGSRKDNIILLSGWYEYDYDKKLISTWKVNNKIKILGKTPNLPNEQISSYLNKPTDWKVLYTNNNFNLYEINSKLISKETNINLKNKIQDSAVYDSLVYSINNSKREKYWDNSGSTQSVTSLSHHLDWEPNRRMLERLAKSKWTKTVEKQRRWKFSIFIICVIIIIFSIIMAIIQLKNISNLLSIYNLCTDLRKFARIYYQILSNILWLSCIANQKTTDCRNYLNDYNTRLNAEKKTSINISQILIVQNWKQGLEWTEWLNNLKSNLFNIVDEETHKILEAEVAYRTISKNSVNESFEIIEAHEAFSGALNFIDNDFTVIINDDKYMNYPWYIFDIIYGNFPNLYGDWNYVQISYYNIMLNASLFLVHLFESLTQWDVKLDEDIIKIKSFTTIVCIVTLALRLLVIALVLTLLNIFQTGIIWRLNRIKDKLTNQDFMNYFVQKVKYLQEMIQFNSSNKEWNNIWTFFQNKYKKKKKDKEHDKKAKENKLQEKDKLNGIIAQMDKKDKKKKLSSDKYKKATLVKITNFYFYMIQAITLYCLCFCLALIFLWLNYLETTKATLFYINTLGYSETTIFSNYAEWQLMIYGNQTLEEASMIFLNTDDPFFLISDMLASLYSLLSLEGIRQKSWSTIIKDHKINPNCKEFYNDIGDSLLNSVNEEYLFYPDIIDVCWKLDLLSFEQDKSILYKELVFALRKNFLRINKYSYDELLSFLSKDDIYYVGLIMNFIYQPIQNSIMKEVIDVAIHTVETRLKQLTYVYIAISIFTEFMIFIIVVFLFFRRFEENEKEILVWAKVFK